MSMVWLFLLLAFFVKDIVPWNFLGENCQGNLNLAWLRKRKQITVVVVGISLLLL